MITGEKQETTFVQFGTNHFTNILPILIAYKTGVLENSPHSSLKVATLFDSVPLSSKILLLSSPRNGPLDGGKSSAKYEAEILTHQ